MNFALQYFSIISVLRKSPERLIINFFSVAEKAFEFEHRDLHWGNVLVRESSVKELSYKIGERQFHIKTDGVEARIIDFTLSRMTPPDDGCEIYNNLADDPALFKCRGNDYQFDIYR